MPAIDQLQGRQIGRVLVKMGKVSRDQVIEALDFQKRKGGALGRILIDLGYIKEADLNVALAAQKGYELVNLEGRAIPKEAIDAVPPQIATTNKVLRWSTIRPPDTDCRDGEYGKFSSAGRSALTDGLQRQGRDRRSGSDR